MPYLYKVQDHERDLLGCSMAFHMMPWLGSMFFPLHTILVSHQNLLLLFAFLMSWHKKLMWHPVSATRQVIQTDGLASGSSSITRARGVWAIMPQSFRPLNMEEERTLLVRGEETTTPHVVKASNFHVPRVHVHQENTQFSTYGMLTSNAWNGAKACEYTIV